MGEVVHDEDARSVGAGSAMVVDVERVAVEHDPVAGAGGRGSDDIDALLRIPGAPHVRERPGGKHRFSAGVDPCLGQGEGAAKVPGTDARTAAGAEHESADAHRNTLLECGRFCSPTTGSVTT